MTINVTQDDDGVCVSTTPVIAPLGVCGRDAPFAFRL